ncbi:MAG TPA: hypothetical protein DEA27_00545 [Candidatus Moranbacteria bacterium]|nr:hypothetical protein [Candidatus Moranbacteria bacterium]
MKEIQTKLAPQAIGPYSQAIIVDDFVFCSGQIPINPETSLIVEGDIKKQVEQVIKNLQAVLQEVGIGLENVVKTEVYLKNMEDFSAMNEVYAEKFIFKPYPARVTVEVARLPKDVLIEIACIAHKKQIV